MKKALAFLLALSMLAAAGCSSIEKKGVKDKNGKENTLETGSQDKDTPEEGEDNEENGSDENENPAASGSYINDDNCLIDDSIQDDGNDACDKAVLYKMAELTIDNCNAVINQDKQAYFDSVNVPGILRSDIIEHTALVMNEEDPEELYSLEQDTFLVAVLACEATDLIDEKALDNLFDEGMDVKKSAKQCGEIFREAADKLTVDNIAELFDEYSVYNELFKDYQTDVPEGFQKDPGSFTIKHDDSAVYSIELDEYRTNERGTFAEFDMIACIGDWEYLISECRVWIDGDVSSVYTNGIMIQENEVKGMSMDEIRDMVGDKESVNESNARAKTAYNAVAEYIADQEMAGRSKDQVFDDGDFMLANSDHGIILSEISDSDVTGGGDKMLLELYKSGDIAAGTVYVGRSDKLDRNFNIFVQFKNDNGYLVGQYPDPGAASSDEGVVFGTFTPQISE